MSRNLSTQLTRQVSVLESSFDPTFSTHFSQHSSVKERTRLWNLTFSFSARINCSISRSTVPDAILTKLWVGLGPMKYLGPRRIGTTDRDSIWVKITATSQNNAFFVELGLFRRNNVALKGHRANRVILGGAWWRVTYPRVCLSRAEQPSSFGATFCNSSKLEQL